MRKLILIGLWVGLLGPLPGRAAAVDISKLPPAAARPVEFTKDIQPIFEASCWNCHGPRKSESGLRLDERAAALKGGDHGAVIVPGRSAESILIHAVAGVHEELGGCQNSKIISAD